MVTQEVKIEYIINALSYAYKETKIIPNNDFILLVSEYEMDMGETIMGIPIYVTSGYQNYTFMLAYKWTFIDKNKSKFMKAFKEFQELYSLGDKIDI